MESNYYLSTTVQMHPWEASVHYWYQFHGKTLRIKYFQIPVHYSS